MAVVRGTGHTADVAIGFSSPVVPASPSMTTILTDTRLISADDLAWIEESLDILGTPEASDA